MARASRLAFIIDAADYFALAKSAIAQARHSVYLIGWDFDLRIRLDPEAQDTGAPDQLGPFLTSLVKQRPDLHIFVLRWDGAMLYTVGRQIIPFLAQQWLTHD